MLPFQCHYLTESTGASMQRLEHALISYLRETYIVHLYRFEVGPFQQNLCGWLWAASGMPARHFLPKPVYSSASNLWPNRSSCLIALQIFD